MNLSDFLLREISEDEADAQRWAVGGSDPTGPGPWAVDTPGHVLVQCAAHRRIVELHEIVAVDPGNDHPHPFGCVICDEHSDYGTVGGGYCDTLRALASVYADRDGYHAGWATG